MEDNAIPLPSGGSVTLRPVTALRSGDKMDVLSGATATDTHVAWQMDLRHGCARLLVVAWSLPYEPNAPLPKDDPQVLRRLEIGDYDALMAAVGLAMTVLFPGPATPDDAARPGSPTEPAGD